MEEEQARKLFDQAFNNLILQVFRTAYDEGYQDGTKQLPRKFKR